MSEIDNSQLIPAMEIAYGSIKENRTYMRQSKLYLPKNKHTGYDGVVVMFTPSREASMDCMNSGFATFYMSGYRCYTTPTKFSTRIGVRTIRANKRTEYRKDFMENRTQKSIRFVSQEELKNLDGRSFIYDMGSWHQLFFQNRLIKSAKYMVESYFLFIDDKIKIVTESYTDRIIYLPVKPWFAKDPSLGILKANLNNPLSMIMWSLYKKPELLKTLVSEKYTLLVVDEENGEFVKIPMTSDMLNLKTSKSIYIKLKTQFKKMTFFRVIEEDEEIENPVAELKKDDLVEDMTRKLTGNTTMKKSPMDDIDDSYREGSSIDDYEDDTTEETETDTEQEINEEIGEVISSEVYGNEDLTNGNTDPSEIQDTIEKKVKTEVLMTKFVPEYSAAKTAQIEEYAKHHNEVIEKQTIAEMKTKIIDKSDFSKVISTHNENIKQSKFVNFEKSYVEKKLKPDIINSVGKLSTADYPIFIESIDKVDTSDAFNQKETWTFNLIDEDGRKQRIVLDIPKIIDNNYVFLSGNKKMILKQRINRPIVKIAPDTVQICTWYNKCMIQRHGQAVDSKTISLKKYISKNGDAYRIVYGNAKVRNKDYRTSLAFDALAKNIVEFKVGTTRFILDLPKLQEVMKEAGINEPMIVDNMLACGITSGKKVVRCSIDGNAESGDSIEDVIISKMSDEERKKIKGTNAGKRFAYARMTIMAQKIPVIFFMLFCEGWTATMKDCGIPYEVYDNTKENRRKNWGENMSTIETMDKIIVYPKYPYENSLLLNGLQGLPISSYTYEELDSKDTYIDMLSLFYSNSNMSYNLDQFKNFLLDDASIEMLRDFNQPTELVPLFFYAVQLLVNNQYVSDIDVSSMRIRSTEIIPQIAYQVVVNAYGKYRKMAGRKRAGKISCPQGEVIKALLSSSLIDEYSVSNPVKTLEKTHECTVRGSTGEKGITLNGQNKTNGMTMARRAYDQSMLGVFGITTSPDGECGVKRTLTVEPNITSTRGYIEVTPKEETENLNSANLFTFAESLTPPGVRHDDPPRSAMMKAQTAQMVMVDDATPVLIGNKVETVVPYHMSGEFCFVAKQDGQIIDVKDGVYVVKYKDGTYDSFETNPKIHKNASEGMYTEVQFTCDHEKGYKFVKDEVLAADPRSFTMNADDKGASMNIGVLCKVAIVSTYDIYEDSEPISKKLSERLGYWVINMKPVSFHKGTYVEKMVNVGDHVGIGDPLVVFDANSGDEEIEAFLASIKGRDGVVQDLIESSQTTIKADESGIIEDIRVYTTVPVEELSPTLQKIVKKYQTKIESKSKFLEKYKNEGDNAYYKCGQILSETTDVVESNYGVIKGTRVDDGVYIEFYIKHKDNIKKGDKNTNYCALKGVTSHVMPEGQEPWSEYRPDEEISAFIAPLGILARKTPSIYTNLFGNKVLIEAKRKLMEDYMKD